MRFEDVYRLAKFGKLLINRKVAGLYFTTPPSSVPPGYYYQHINLNGKDYYFLYREFSLKIGPVLAFSGVRKRVEKALSELLEEIQKECSAEGENVSELEFFTKPLPFFTFAGRSPVPYPEEKENFAYVRRGKEELYLLLGRGELLPKRAYELVFHPLFFFPKRSGKLYFPF